MCEYHSVPLIIWHIIKFLIDVKQQTSKFERIKLQKVWMKIWNPHT